MSEAADLVIRIEHADDNACDPAFDDPFSAWDLRTVSRRAWLQRREEGRTRQRLVPEFGLKKCVLGMVSGSEFTSEGLAQHYTVPHDDGSDLGRNTSFFAHALPRERDGSLHKRPLPLRRGMVRGHCPIVLTQGEFCASQSAEDKSGNWRGHCVFLVHTEGDTALPSR